MVHSVCLSPLHLDLMLTDVGWSIRDLCQTVERTDSAAMCTVEQDQCDENNKATATPPRHTSSKDSMQELDVEWGGLLLDLRRVMLKLKPLHLNDDRCDTTAQPKQKHIDLR